MDTRDVDGIEAFLASIQGVPGHVALRFNAKKALKRIKEQDALRNGVAGARYESVSGGVISTDGKLGRKGSTSSEKHRFTSEEEKARKWN